jgi:hypothetical protein
MTAAIGGFAVPGIRVAWHAAVFLLRKLSASAIR